MNKGFVKLGALFAVVMVALLAGVLVFTRPSVQSVFATSQPPVEDGCEHSCPVVHFEWDKTVYDACPEGYSVRTGHSDQCRKNSWPFTVIDRPSHQEHHSVDVAYEKSNDPNKCHRPSDEDLKDVYGMDSDARHDFKDANPETKDSEDVVPEGYYHEDGACYPQKPVCTDPEATNYDSEVDKTEVSDNKVCEYPQVRDACPYINGQVDEEIQATVPENLEAKVEVIGEVEVTNCVDKPTPPVEEQPKTEEHHDSFSPASAPVCSDGSTIKLPANPHVIRGVKNPDGTVDFTKAVVNWFETEGDEANIYYKEVHEANWSHSVRDIKVSTDNNPEHFVSVTIGELDPNLGYTFGIQQKHGCGGGETVVAVIVDGPQSKLFPITYWEWDR